MSSDLAVADLQRSGIAWEAAEAAGLKYLNTARKASVSYDAAPAVLIPYMDPLTGAPMTFGPGAKPFSRVRYLVDVKNKDGKLLRYAQPSNSGVRVYFPPSPAWAELWMDTAIPLVITEGEKKALAACLNGFACVGLGGVWSWRDDDDGLCGDLRRIPLVGRPVVIAYDSDAADKPAVAYAEAALGSALARAGADVTVARLRPTRSGEKRGVDDYIAAGELAQLEALLTSGRPLSGLDEAVARLNRDVAYIATEDVVYELATNAKLTKSAFLSGSKYSSERIVAEGERRGPADGRKRETSQSLAALWLRHPAARRYNQRCFNPATLERDIPNADGGVDLNMWTGLAEAPGDVAPFFELVDHLMAQSPKEVSDLFIPWLAHKVQRPEIKMPIAFLFIGEQGSGKSMLAKIILRMFGTYGYALPSKGLLSDFNPFAEKRLMVVMDEVQPAHLAKGMDALKRYISEEDEELNVKYVSQHRVRTYTQFLLTTNRSSAAAFDHDDRRMVVCHVPQKREPAFYDRVGQWMEDDGPRRLCYWLKRYDLGDWTWPKHAPMTQMKQVAYEASLDPVAALTREMRAADENVVYRWLSSALAWATAAELSNVASERRAAAETRAALQHLPIRPIYTAQELAWMFPEIAQSIMGYRKGATPQAIPGQIMTALIDNGVPLVRNAADPAGFTWRGVKNQYLAVANWAEWREPLSQDEFEGIMSQSISVEAYGLQLAEKAKRKETRK